MKTRGVVTCCCLGLMASAAVAVAEPRTAHTRVRIQAPELREAIYDTELSAIETEYARTLGQLCADKYPYLVWRPLPSGTSAAADTIPMLTLDVVSEPSGKARTDILGLFSYCIGEDHDVRMERPRDREVLFRGDESVPRGGLVLRQRISDLLVNAIGRDVPELGAMRDQFIPNIVIAESLQVKEDTTGSIADSTHRMADPAKCEVILPVRADNLRAKKDSRLLAMFCAVIGPDTLESCSIQMSTIGMSRDGLQSCRVTESDCGGEDWLTAVRGRLRQPVSCALRVYMSAYVFNPFGHAGHDSGLDSD